MAVGNPAVNVANLNPGTTAVSATGNDTATTTFTECVSALVIVTCTAVSASGIFVPVLAQTVDGTNYTALTPASGSPMAAVSATGVQVYRFSQVAGKVRTQWTKTSGTSITAVVTIIGLITKNSTLATAV